MHARFDDGLSDVMPMKQLILSNSCFYDDDII